MKGRHSSWLSKIGVEAHKAEIDLRESLSLAEYCRADKPEGEPYLFEMRLGAYIYTRGGWVTGILNLSLI